MKMWIELFAILLMVGGLGGVFYLIIKKNLAIGLKTIQFVAVVFILPMLLILGLSGNISREALSILFATIIGFLLSGIGKE